MYMRAYFPNIDSILRFVMCCLEKNKNKFSKNEGQQGQIFLEVDLRNRGEILMN